MAWDRSEQPWRLRIRVVAEIYHGIDFPDDWVTHSTDITGVMGRALLISVIALLDAERQPIAVCWQTADRDEQFVRSRFDGSVDTSVLEGLERDMTMLARYIGVPEDLLSTLLWEPRMVPRSQAKLIQKTVFARGKYSTTMEWNTAPREIYANAADLLLMVRKIDEDLAESLPATVNDMHTVSEVGGAETILMLPVKPGSPNDTSMAPAGGPLKTLLFAAVMLIGIALVSAYLAGDI
jgi:hypothetical protein